MKLHLPVFLRKALLACFAFTFACSATSAAADLTLGGDASLTIDYAAANSIPDLAGGTLQLSGDTVLLLSSCGVGDGKTYTLLTGVGALSDADGNPLTLTDENSAASLYFDTSRPGTGFWADGWLQLAQDGSVQLVLHAEDVQAALTITTRQTGSNTYNYYEDVIFQNTASGSSSSYGGAIHGGWDSTITLSNNGSVTFSGNTASSTGESAYAYGGAIDGSTITLSNNGSVTFRGNTATSTGESTYAYGGAIYGNRDSTITLSNNGSVTFSGNTASSSYDARGGAIYVDSSSTITLSDNGSVVFEKNKSEEEGGAIYGYVSTIELRNNGSVVFSENEAVWGGGAIYVDSSVTLSNNGSVSFIGNTASGSFSACGGAIYGGDDSTITLNNNGDVIFSGNKATSNGGAIYATGNLSIRNNESVLFEKNVEKSGSTYRLRCIDARRSGGEIFLSAAAGKSIEFRDSVYIVGSTLNLNKDYGGIAQTGDIIFTGKYTETHLNDILAADGAGRRASADEVLQSRISDVTSITVHAGRLIVEDNAVYKGEGITVHDGASVQVRDAALLHNGTYKSSSYNLTFNSGSTLGCSGSSIISGQVQMQEGSVLSFDCSDGACETTIGGSLSIEGALSVTVDAGRSSLAENTVLMYVSNEVVGWDSANITLVGEDGGTLTWVDNSLVWNYNPDTYRYYHDGGYAWLNERVVGAVCMHHRRDACFYYSSLSSGGGAAIYAPFVLLNHNSNVLLMHNTVSDMREAYGGAIYGPNVDFYVDLSYNDQVYFERNFAYSSRADNTRAGGGAIYSNINGTVRLVGNKKVEFYENAVSSESDVYGVASGAAIYGGGINIDHNDEVLFAGNNVFGHREDLGYGGAIMSQVCGVSICNNQKVRFEGNSVSALRAYGGAVVVYNKMFSLNDNDIVKFARNKAAARESAQGAFGGAIYTYNNLSIRNNDSVEFYQNAEVSGNTYRLRSIYASGGDEISLSAGAGKCITFRDSIYIAGGSTFKLNQDYTYQDEEGVLVTVEQKGDIIFTGETTVDDLYAVKGKVYGTDEEVLASRTTEVRRTANLYNGRLIIKEGAIWSGDGITVAPAEGKTYKPTLLLQNGHLSHYEPSGTARNVVTIKSGATLEVAGKNTASYTSLILEGGSALTFNLSAANTSADTAVLCMSDSSLTLPQSGTLTLKLVAFDGITDSQAYALLTGVNQPSNWNSANITVASGTDGWDVSMADLRWDGTTLWLCPELVTATWTNESRDGKWNTTSLNWEQNEVDYEYRDGVAVVFGDTGAGTVTLVGNIAPKSVLVNSTKDYIWVADDTVGGKLTGSMKLTKKGEGTLEIKTSNDYTGGTEIKGGTVLAGTATALGTGDVVLNGGTLEIGATGLDNSICNTGTSTLQTSDRITHVLTDTISNTGTLTLSGSFDASALQLNKTEAGRLSLSGERVGLTESGFSQGVEYTVLIVDGGSTVNAGAGISHKDYLSRTQLVLGEDGVARAGAEVDYTHYFLTGGDSAEVSKIAEVSAQHQETLTGVTMDSGELTVDQSVAVSATGGSIVLTEAAELSGTIDNTAVSTGAGDYSSTISAVMGGTSSLAVNGGNIIVSGANSYTGGTVVNGGTLVAGNAQAFGSGDVVVNGATLDLNQYSIANKVFMNGNSTIGYADGASHIVLGNGAAVNFRNGYTLGRGKHLTVAGAATYTGALTLGGGTLELGGQLTVQGDVVFASGATTTLDISGWKGLDDGDVLADLGSSNSGYADGCLSLEGIAGDWELDFDASTGVLTLVAVKDEPLPEPEPEPMPEPEFLPTLNHNQQIVFDTIKDIMGGGTPDGLLGELGKEVTGTRDEEKLKELLDSLGGAEYATLMSSQQDAARGHMRRLRNSLGNGWALMGTRSRANIEIYHNRMDVDGDSHGRGYELNETGGQFSVEFIQDEKTSGGFALASGRSRLQPDGGMTQHSDNTYVDAFLMHRDGGYTARTSLGVGVHSYELDRNVMGNAVSAETEGSSVNFMHESAYAMALDESNSVQVFGAVESSLGKLGAFHEKGADTASLQVKGQDAWMTTLSVGARYMHHFAVVENAPSATLSLQAGVEASLGDTDSEVEVNFSGARRHGFKQSGTRRDTFGYNLGASLHVPVSARAAVYASGDAVLRGDSSEVNANVGVQLAF